ncbi:MAG: hypothetical protein KY468_13245, partial [Armatimonadetes bacterium]|nr:hypothetical protein [Armatimonadota bacterium]
DRFAYLSYGLSAILAFIDVAVVRGALTCFAPNFSMLLQGIGLILLLSVTLAAMALGGRGNFSVGGFTLGLGPLLILVAYLLSAYTVYRLRDEPRWKPVDNDGCDDQPQRGNAEKTDDGQEEGEQGEKSGEQTSLASLLVRFGIGSLIILIAGWAIVMVSDALAEQTGLGAGFIGATLVAISTSLPEVSTTFSAAKNQNYDMAVSNVFGSNSFNVAQLFVLGLVYTEAPIFQEVAPSAFFATGMVILVTCVYLWGMLERRNRTILNMGYDSAAVLLLYLLGTWGLFVMR